jgi:hypothetical protein
MFTLGGEKRLEDMTKFIVRDASSIVGYEDPNAIS